MNAPTRIDIPTNYQPDPNIGEVATQKSLPRSTILNQRHKSSEDHDRLKDDNDRRPAIAIILFILLLVLIAFTHLYR